ncbi:MAG: TVP38/TMEM64 family protein [Phycisphaerae bacterium]
MSDLDTARPADTTTAAPKADVLDLAALFKRLGPTGPLAVIAATLPLVGAITLISTLGTVAPWLQSHAELGIALYIVGFAILAGVALLPTHASAILGGWAFGFAMGLPAALAGFVGGALIGYAIARPVAGDRVVAIISEHKKWRAVYDALLNSGFWRALLIVTLLRLPPNSPFAMTNLVLASTRVPLLVYSIGTTLGMIPRIAIVVWLSSHVAQLDFGLGKNWWMIAGGIVLTLIVFAIIAQIGHQAILKVTAAERRQPT